MPLAALVLALALAGCHLDMWNQPRHESLEKSDFFSDKLSARPAPEGRVAYAGKLRAWAHPLYAGLTGSETVPGVLDEAFYTGKVNGNLVTDNYFEVSQALLERGKERFEITCLPCHGPLGNGQGFIPARGFPNPPTYHQDRLRTAEDGHFFDVMTNGFGRMYSYASRQLPEDRWAIVAYIRALQLSQHVDPEKLPTTARREVRAAVNRQEHAGEATDPNTSEAAGHGAHE